MVIPNLSVQLDVTEQAGSEKPGLDATDWLPNWVTSASLLGAIWAGIGCIFLFFAGFVALVNYSSLLCLPLFGASAVCGWICFWLVRRAY